MPPELRCRFGIKVWLFGDCDSLCDEGDLKLVDDEWVDAAVIVGDKELAAADISLCPQLVIMDCDKAIGEVAVVGFCGQLTPPTPPVAVLFC